MTKKRGRISRRGFMKGAGAIVAGSSVGGLALARRAEAQQTEPRFLIVLSAAGGASILDGPLAIRASESTRALELNTFEDARVIGIDGSPLRAVDIDRGSVGAIPMAFGAKQSAIVRKHARDMMVVTTERTSVNHTIGQRRSVTGNEAWAGRTLQECVAAAYGEGFALPNVHLASGGGFTQRGTDRSLPSYAYGEPITDPALWPLALDASKGLARPVDRALLERARGLRARVEARSSFDKVLGQSEAIQKWRHLRRGPREALEAQNLIDALMLFPDSARTPLARFGLSSSAAALKARERFPLYAEDSLEAQAALAFLLIRSRVSVSVTLGPSFDVELRDGVGLQGGSVPEGGLLNPPIAFDFSHQGHRSVQAMMWQRIYRVADGLIDLLKGEEWADGESLWDRTMIYIATDFGRTKGRPTGAEEFPTGHDLNNGVALFSPLVRPNSVLGGVDAQTGLTYGFDPQTGAPDVGRRTQEAEVFAGILHALGVDTTGSGLPDMRAMRKLA